MTTYLEQYSLIVNEKTDLTIKKGTTSEGTNFYAFSTSLPIIPYKACILSFPVDDNGIIKDVRIFYDPYTIPSNEKNVSMIVFARPISSTFPLYFYKSRDGGKLTMSKSSELDPKLYIMLVPFPIYVFDKEVSAFVCKDGLCHPTTSSEKGVDIVSCSKNCNNDDQYGEIVNTHYTRLIVKAVIVCGLALALFYFYKSFKLTKSRSR